MAGVAAGVQGIYYSLVVRDANHKAKVYFPREVKPFSDQQAGYTSVVMFTQLKNQTTRPGESVMVIGEVGYSIDQVKKFVATAKIRCDVANGSIKDQCVFEELTPEEQKMETVELVNNFWQSYVEAMKQRNYLRERSREAEIL